MSDQLIRITKHIYDTEGQYKDASNGTDARSWCGVGSPTGFIIGHTREKKIPEKNIAFRFA